MKRILYLGLDPTHYISQGEIVHWPIIQIVRRPLSDPLIKQALQDFDRYSHVIITSKSTVAILQEYLPQLGIDLQSWQAKSTLAVGKVTAKHLNALGIYPASIAEEETAEGIIQDIQKLSLKSSHFFWPHSSQSRPLIKDFLITQNARLTDCILYDPISHVPGPLPDLNHFDEIVFTSPSTVDAFLSIFGSFPVHVQLTAIGPVTMQYLWKYDAFAIILARLQ